MSQKRILVVDDREDNRRILSYRLRTMGDFEILEAASGQEVLEMVSREPFDLIFMDLRMPLVDGWEATRRIRALQSPMRDVPIVAVTAQAQNGDKEKALAAGCDDFIPKPLFGHGIIQEKIERLLASGTGS